VDIISNEDVLRDVLTIAAGGHAGLGNNIVSSIDDIAAHLPL